jgi:hypothetical protein
METDIDIPEENIITFKNSFGEERKFLLMGSLVCIKCGLHQGLTYDYRTKKITIREFHQRDCDYFRFT